MLVTIGKKTKTEILQVNIYHKKIGLSVNNVGSFLFTVALYERSKIMKAKEKKIINVRFSDLYVGMVIICYSFYRLGISQGIKEAKHVN